MILYWLIINWLLIGLLRMPGNPTSHHGGGGISRREHQHREIETQEGFQTKIDSYWSVEFWLIIGYPISIEMKTHLSQQEMKLIQCMLYQWYQMRSMITDQEISINEIPIPLTR